MAIRRMQTLSRFLKSRRLRLEPLEKRTLLAGGMIDLGPSDNIALDQPRVAMELLVSTGPGPDDWASVGPSMFNTFLLDTGANSVLAMATAVNDLSGPPIAYQTQGRFLEAGVAGDHELDISATYRFDFAGTSGIRHTIDDARILSDADKDFSMFGPWGLVGMPAMIDRVTSIDMSVWSAGGSLMDLFMRVDFSSEVPADPGHRYSVPVDSRIKFDPVAQTISGQPPVWADVPFLTAIPTSNGLGLEGNFLFDTGAQMSVISERMAFDLGLDANGNGTLNDEALRFETVGGVGGTISAPVLFIDELRVPTNEGIDLVWTDLQVLALDIDLPGTELTLDGVFGSDLLTSGWVEAFFSGGDDGYFQQVHFDFRTTDDGSGPTLTGDIIFDLSPAVDQVIPAGPGVRVLETLGYTEVLEGGTIDQYRLVLNSQPTADVTVAFAALDGEISVEEEALPKGPSVTFTSANWDVPQVVNVTATDDDLAEGAHSSRVIHTVSSADPGYDGIPARHVDVNILDDDLTLLEIIQTDDSTDVTEGGASDSFQVRLASAPAAGSMLHFEDTSLQTVAYVQGRDRFTDPWYNVLEFNGGNWNTWQTIIVEAQDDALVEGPHQTSLTLSVIEGLSVIGQSTLVVNVQDNDIGSVVIVETADSTDVDEDGTVDTYTVVLAKLPTHDVRIDLQNAAGQLTPVDAAHPENAFLLFTPANWNTPQTVRVSAVDDDAAEGTQIAQIVHRATSDDDGFDALAIRDVTVRIEDNDAAGVSITTGGSAEVAEGGPADTYSIVLTSRPNADVQIHLQTGDQILAVDEASPANAFVVFTPDNWDTTQVIRITAVDDQLVEDAVDVSISHEALSTDANYRGTHDLTVRVTDNDAADVILTETGGSTGVTEGGVTDTYHVALTSEPTADVRIDLSNADGQVAAVSDANPGVTHLVFTAANWSVPQAVRVTAVDDDVVEGAHLGLVSHSVSSTDANYQRIAVADVTANVTDNDSAGVIITETDGSTDVTEGGVTDTYHVVLTSEPTSEVRIDLANVDGQVAAVSDANPGVTHLVFTAANWSVPQAVRVTAVDDDVVEGAHHGLVSHSVSSTDADYQGIGVADVTADVTDDDAAGVIVTETGGSTGVTEAGVTDTYHVVLTSEPTSEVRIDLVNADGQLTAVSYANPGVTHLVFTAANWSVPQAVGVTAVDDDVVEGAHLGLISHSASSTDADYQGIGVADVTADVTDDDAASVIVTETGGSTGVTEGGVTDTYHVVLTSEPTSEVRIDLANADGQVAAVSDANPGVTHLVFTAANWSVPQAVRVTAVDDDVVEGAHHGLVSHSVSSTDANYEGIGVADVTADVTDNDAAGVIVTETGGSTGVTEGGVTDTYHVVLTSEPTSEVRIDLANADGQLTAVNDAHPGDAFLVFDASNWGIAQTVRVAAVDDEVKEGAHAATVDHTAASADSNYGGIGIPVVTVAIVDNDNRPPVAEVDAYFTDVDPAAWGSVLDNDHDPNGDDLTAVRATDAVHGAVSLAPDGSFEYTAALGYFGLDSFTYMANDGELDSNVVTVAINVVQPLGAVASSQLGGLDASEGPLWLRLETGRGGILTAQASFAEASGDVQLDLYGPARVDPPLVTSSGAGGTERIDFLAGAAGEAYYLKVSGANNDVDLQVANLVEKAGTEVTVHGTDGADTFEFDASSSALFTVNSLDYSFGEDQITRTTFAGGLGEDQVVFRGGPGTETALLYQDHGIFKDGSRYQTETWSAEVSEVESITAFAGIGSMDEAFIYDSPGDDTFEVWPFHGTMSGDGIALEAFDFAYTYGYATTRDGGEDLAVFHDSPRNDKLKLDWPQPNQHFVKMYRGDYYSRAKMFETVRADFSQGKDLVRLFDSSGDDTLVTQRDTTRMHGPGFDLTVAGYDNLLAYGGTGRDVAYFEDSPADDTIRARGHKTMMWSGSYSDPDYKLTARRFDEVHASADGFGDDFDMAKLHDTTGDNHVEAEYLPGEVSRAAVFKVSDSQLKMIYEALAFDQVNSYRTTGNDTKDIAPGAEEFLKLRDGWE